MDAIALSPARTASGEIQESTARWLGGARAADAERAPVRIKALQLTQLLARPGERAVVCHDFVRSLKLEFGRSTARGVAHVLLSTSGTALEKSDLLIALLRCCAIPARLRVYSMRPDVFRGLADQDGPVLHPVVEAFPGQTWLSVDTHHMDIALALGARTKLINERRRCGYGIHLDGAASWDGRSDALSFLCLRDPATTPLRDFGIFHGAAELEEHATEIARLGRRANPLAGLRVSSRASKLRSRAANC